MSKEKTHTTEEYVKLLVEIDRKNKIIKQQSEQIKSLENQVYQLANGQNHNH